MKHIFILLSIFLISRVTPQTHSKSIHQEQLEYFNSLGNATTDFYEANTTAAQMNNSAPKSACNLNKVVYGWHPYWMGNSYLNYQWDLLTHLSFFSYEVDVVTGNAITTHGFSTSAAIDAALNAGVKVTLTVTMFSGHSTFFGNATAQQNLITNLINLVSSRGIDGVNIDFEGLPSAYKTQFNSFMVNLANQMHAAIPNSEVSTVLYAVDWSGVFDFSVMANTVDLFIIMGYDYYYSGSANTGPVDPLYHFGNTYNYTLSKSISYYLDKGCPREKLILGLPYYGRTWSATNSNIPSTTTGYSASVIYNTIKNNALGNYSSANHTWEDDSFSDVYIYQESGQTRQTYATMDDGFEKRLEHINHTGIGGMGIWALGYDDGYTERWDAIRDYMTDCYASPCVGSIHDFGGPTRDYYNNENYIWTISPDGAASISLNFTSFDVENNYDFLYIYDGNSTSAQQVPGSPFTGTTIPQNIVSSTGALTFRFLSDGGVVAPGFNANYVCTQDIIAPTISLDVPIDWITEDFTANIVVEDNIGGTGIQSSYYLISDYDGTEWRANADNGFFADYFEGNLHQDWNSVVGNWSTANGELIQTDETSGNTNVSIPLNQNDADQFLYHFKASIDGTDANRRGGFHFMCDSDTDVNRGNSYFVFFRLDNGQHVQVYKVINDDFGLPIIDFPFPTTPGQQYDYKITMNKTTGLINLFRDNDFVVSWQDNNPHLIGDYISFRTGNAKMNIESLEVYKYRENEATIVSVGNTSDIRYQNNSPAQYSGKIQSLAIDNANNLSNIDIKTLNVDYTPANDFLIYDGETTAVDINLAEMDISQLKLSANWENAIDLHSEIAEYKYSIGMQPGLTNVKNWTSVGLNISVTATSFDVNLIDLNNQFVYFNVMAINHAGLQKELSSDGQKILINDGSLGINKEVAKSVKIYPNPTKTKVYLETELKIIRVRLVNMLGAEVEIIFNKQDKSINLSSLSNGLYHLTIETTEGIIEKRIVKE
ncbi:MAG: glycosyl hydrolase family 18 protein [Brumimicrobium sp.]